MYYTVIKHFGYDGMIHGFGFFIILLNKLIN